MKKTIVYLLVLALVSFGLWFFMFNNKKQPVKREKQQPLAVSTHSDAFNLSTNKMMEDYYNMVESFVVWDSAAVNTHAALLKEDIDSIKIDDFRQDTIIYETAALTLSNVKAEAEGLLQEPSFREKKMSLNSLTQYIYDFLRIVRYDQAKVYFMECPDALGDEVSGNWLSKTREVRNPYLGTQHPTFKDGKLNCGTPKDTLNFVIPKQ